EEVVKLVDFGIAALDPGNSGDHGKTDAAMFMGTPQYMSPEQVRGRPLDHRSDLWSLAVVAYQVLTGKLPFSAKNVNDMIVAICADPILPPSCLVPELGAEMDAFFERALARDPAGRFQSVDELAAAFVG